MEKEARWHAWRRVPLGAEEEEEGEGEEKEEHICLWGGRPAHCSLSPHLPHHASSCPYALMSALYFLYIPYSIIHLYREEET